jgi:hypothetical protein
MAKIVQDFLEKITNQSRSSTESNKDKEIRKITFYVDGNIYVHPKEEEEHIVAFYASDKKVKGAMYLCIDPREVNPNCESFPTLIQSARIY